MFLKTKNRKALSAVLTTLIILVASVVLGTGVVLFGTSLFQTNAQSSGLAVQGVHVWLNATKGMTTTYVWGAAEIRNSGDKILSVNEINVRGTQVPFANWYVDTNSSQVTTANFQSQLTYTGTATGGPSFTPYSEGEMQQYAAPGGTIAPNCVASTTQFSIYEWGTTATTNPSLCFTQASGPISLKPGATAIVYFEVPVGVFSPVDGGSNTNVAMYAGSVGSPQSVTVQTQS